MVKAWPSFELLPKEPIKTMFINDMKGYSEFAASDFYPRPNVYLASYDVEKDRWTLVFCCSSIVQKSVGFWPHSKLPFRCQIVA